MEEETVGWMRAEGRFIRCPGIFLSGVVLSAALSGRMRMQTRREMKKQEKQEEKEGGGGGDNDDNV